MNLKGISARWQKKQREAIYHSSIQRKQFEKTIFFGRASARYIRADYSEDTQNRKNKRILILVLKNI